MVSESVAGWREPCRHLRVLLILLGIAAGQFVLYGPSLFGQKILLPLDLLAGPAVYLPQTPDVLGIPEGDGTESDLVWSFEPARRFAGSELRAGRLATWAPYQYAGVPFIWPKFSPFLALECCTASPVVLAWAQLAASLVAGLGAYLFFRIVLRVSFWPAALGAWCYPLTGFFIIWQGFYTALPVCWLPWLLLAVDSTVRGRWQLASLGLALAACLTVISGALDIAGQVLLISGLYALWRLGGRCFERPLQESAGADSGPTAKPILFGRLAIQRMAGRKVIRVLVGLSAGWLLGLLLAGPFLLPVLEYTKTGARMVRRSAGAEERPPVGLDALPQVVLPDMYGITRQPGLRYGGGAPQQESSATGYAGLLLTLVVAPLAFCNRRYRNFAVLWVLFLIFSLSWCLNIPALVSLLRLPGLNMMSHNRLAFMSGFALVALATVALETLLSEPFRWRHWMWLPLGLLTTLCGWCLYRSLHLPEPIATRIGVAVSRGTAIAWVHGSDGIRRVQAWFQQYYAASAVLSGIGVLCWIFMRSGQVRSTRLVALLGVLLIGELLWFGYGRNVQSDSALYYPPIPVLHSVAKASAGRVIGFGCLPAPLGSMSGLRDIRGYDAVDPARLVELVLSAADPGSTKPRYAPTMEIAPKVTTTPDGDIQLPPVLDMLGVRYVIFRGAPFPKARPIFQGEDYWVLQNPRALPRVFVPEHVEWVTNDASRLQKLESTNYSPREVAYVESPVTLPDVCRGTAEITDEIPMRVNVSVHMETPGLVVLSDLWDKGWHAYLNSKPMPILRANHAVRGVVVPAGSHTLQFKYEPASFTWGLRLAGFAAVILLSWLGISLWRTRKLSLTPTAVPDVLAAQPSRWD